MVFKNQHYKWANLYSVMSWQIQSNGCLSFDHIVSFRSSGIGVMTRSRTHTNTIGSLPTKNGVRWNKLIYYLTALCPHWMNTFTRAIKNVWLVLDLYFLRFWNLSFSCPSVLSVLFYCLCNRWMLVMKRTTSKPFSILRYDVDKGQYFSLELFIYR